MGNINSQKTQQPQKHTMNKAIIILLVLALSANIEAIKVLRTNKHKVQESKFLETTEEEQPVLAEVEMEAAVETESMKHREEEDVEDDEDEGEGKSGRRGRRRR